MPIIGQTITEPLPTPSDPINDPGPQYATKLKAFLDEVKTRLEASVTQASLSIDSAFNLVDNPLTNAQYLALKNLTAGVGPSNSLEVIDGELFFVDGSGASVKLTSNGSLNSASVSGFTGDYGTGNEEAIYTTVNQLYEFMFGSGATDYAAVKAESFEAVSTIDAGTTITAADLTLSSDLNLTGKLVRGDRERLVSACEGHGGGGGGGPEIVLGGQRSNFVRWVCNIPVEVGEILKSVEIALYDQDATGTWSWAVKRFDRTTGTETTLASGSGVISPAATWVAKVLSGIAHTVTQDNVYYIEVVPPFSSIDYRAGGFAVTYEEV